MVNDEVEKATDKVSKIIDVEHLRVGRTYYIVDEICHNGNCDCAPAQEK